MSAVSSAIRELALASKSFMFAGVGVRDIAEGDGVDVGVLTGGEGETMLVSWVMHARARIAMSILVCIGRISLSSDT
jgi:hypothetical protein